MALHPPAARRAIVRRLKSGEHPTTLVADAKAITDPTHSAVAMLCLAADPRLPAKKAAGLVRDATKGLMKLDRPGRFGEAWGDALAAAAPITRGTETQVALDRLHKSAAMAIKKLPNGNWIRDAMGAISPHIQSSLLPPLMERALHNQGAEVASAKPLLARDPGLQEIVMKLAAPDVASRLLARVDGNQALSAAWAIEDPEARREALRVWIWQATNPSEMEKLGHDAWNHDSADAAAVQIMLAARADKLDLPAGAYFAAAKKAVARLDGSAAVKAQKKLNQAMEKAGLQPLEPVLAAQTPSTVPGGEEQAEAEIQTEVVAGTRHVLALVNGYTGAMGATHVRAIARSAPLCIAFNLDLAILGFPVADAAELTAVVSAETNVGEDGDYTQQLFDAGRLQCLELNRGMPELWPGTPVATTPHPAPGKDVKLSDVKSPICLVVGLGKQGLPKRMLNAVPVHHELTGKGVSLETATAMGILADRLGRIPV